jgi:hypothetical protein
MPHSVHIYQASVITDNIYHYFCNTCNYTLTDMTPGSGIPLVGILTRLHAGQIVVPLLAEA